ncbi:MAG TPA: cytochrome c maturation protein CcmE [Thermoanaerobaculia bacterium]|nr:cytochrome c maturation protein CcmE [Thermoanaerobaculia bacterium]
MTAEAMSATALNRRRTRWFMAGAFAVAAIAFVVIAAGGINKNLVYYWTPSDLHAAGDKAYGATIRLGGMVAKGSVRNLGGASGIEFDVKDATRVVHVKSSGVPPQMFRENIGVVVEGTMTRGGYFESNRLMVSHSNEYRAPAKGHPTDKDELQRLMRSTEGLNNT